MKKLLWTVVILACLFVIYRVLMAFRPGGVQARDTFGVTIVMNGNSCTINPPAPKIDQDQRVQWYGPPGFVVTFADQVFNTGSPFPDANGGWQKTFSSANSLTTPATLTPLEKIIPFTNIFPLQSVTVNGQPCYDRDAHADPNMKVIVNQ